MCEIKTFHVNPLMENCYIISDDSHEACIIDPGCMFETEWTAIKRYINDKGLKLVHMLCTHLHFDHIMGCGFVHRDYQLDIEGSMDDLPKLKKLTKELNMDWTHVCQLHGDTASVASSFDVSSFPTTIIIDPDGKIIYRGSGSNSTDKLKAKLREICGE